MYVVVATQEYGGLEIRSPELTFRDAFKKSFQLARLVKPVAVESAPKWFGPERWENDYEFSIGGFDAGDARHKGPRSIILKAISHE